MVRSEGFFYSRGIRCAAWVFRPSAPLSANVPVIVMAHGFGCIRALRLPAYAQWFAAAGYVMVVFDYRWFGDSDGQPRQLLDIGAQLADWRAAIEWARTLEGVDPQRFIGWGTSLSGGHVLTLAGAGAPLTAIIAQVPDIEGLVTVRTVGVRHAARLVPVALDDTWRALLHCTPRYLAAGLMPRATLQTYPGKHFDVYVEPLFTTVIADQLEFLRAVAPVTRSA